MIINNIQSIQPHTIERSCSGWLAVTKESELVRFGVIGKTKEDAISKFHIAAKRWGEILDNER